MLSGHRVQCIKNDDGGRHKVDVPMDRLADPFGSTLDLIVMEVEEECGGCKRGNYLNLSECI